MFHEQCVRTYKPRRGAVVPLVAMVLPVLLVLLGFAVDVAYMQNVRAELRMATDAASRAAATELARTGSPAVAQATAVRIAEANTVASAPLELDLQDIAFGRSEEDATGRFVFSEGLEPFNAVRVNGQRTADSLSGAVSLYFGRLVGTNTFQPTASAVSSFASFDICLVLDRSSSMKLDLDDPGMGLYTSDPRFCSPPGSVSRWAALEVAVNVFVGMLQASNASEQVSLVTYSSDISGASWLNTCNKAHQTTEGATVDLPLTGNLSQLQSGVTAWGDALFNGNTHIELGIRKGADAVLGAGSRSSADKVLIILTDGHENVGDALLAADYCTTQGIVCHTLTFSEDADKSLMAQVAARTDGKHLHANSQAELIEVFRLVAGQLARVTD